MPEQDDIVSLVTVVGLITFIGSTYMIMYADRIYPVLSPFLSVFERKGKKKDEHRYHKSKSHEIILFGHNRVGFDILESLRKIKRKFLIIDYNPETVIDLSKDGYECMYGDANDSEFLDEINFAKVKMVISTIPVMETNLLIINKIKKENKQAIIAVVSYQIDEAERLYEEGATYVIMPHFLGGRHFSTMIEKNKLSMSSFLKEKIAHVEHLKFRKNIGHSHMDH
jgi:Trk K+ transport system NAD-binding subunit